MDYEKEWLFWKNRAEEEMQASEDTVRERDALLEERAAVQAAWRSMFADSLDAYEELVAEGEKLIERMRGHEVSSAEGR